MILSESKAETMRNNKSYTLIRILQMSISTPLSAESLIQEATDVRNFIEVDDDNLDILIKLHRQKNKIHHIEFSIEQNRIRGEELSKQCNKIMRGMEMLAFNFLFYGYLIGKVDMNSVYKFMDACINPNFNLTNGTRDDVKLVMEHINELQSIILKFSDDILNNNVNVPFEPKRTSEFIVYLKEQKNMLKKEIKKKREIIEKEENTKIDFEEYSLTINEFEIDNMHEEFVKWMLNEIGNDIPEGIDENIELKCLINTIARRLAIIVQLHESIKSMKKSLVSRDQLNYTYCEPQDLDNSVFFTNVKETCNFFKLTYQSIQEQINLIPICLNALDGCKNKLNTMITNSKKLTRELENQISNVKKKTLDKKQQIENLRSVVQSFINEIKLKNPLPVIPSLPQDNYYILLQRILTQKLCDVRNDQHLTQEIQNQLSIIQQIVELRNNAVQLSTEQNQLINSIAEKDRSILTMVMDYCKAEQEISLQTQELNYIQEYEDSLKDLLNSLEMCDLENWCETLDTIGKSLLTITDSQKEIISKLSKYKETSSMEEEASKKQKEIEDLSSQNYKLSYEIGKAKIELDEAFVEKYILEKKTEYYQENFPDYVNTENKEQVEQFKTLITCPICKLHRRDVILSTCGHPLCHECIQRNTNHQCPICSVPYTDLNVKNFIIQ